MAANRETIFAALFARLNTLVDPDLANGAVLRYATRVFEGWDETAPSQMPAAQLRKGPEVSTSRRGLPPLWTLTAFIVLYVRQDEDRETPASTAINGLLTAVERLLERTPTEAAAAGPTFSNNPDAGFGTTLGGLCYSCQIAGTVEIFEGPIDTDSVVLIPLEILTTA